MQSHIYLSEKINQEEIDNFLNQVAEAVVKRGFELPAILFLEAHKPLSFVASQMLLVASPLFAPLIGFDKIDKLSYILSDRKNIEKLIEKIENPVEKNSTKAIPD
ncbi:MAG: hypothetical protein SNJ70_06225 [Armatimonadota bacterium]